MMGRSWDEERLKRDREDLLQGFEFPLCRSRRLVLSYAATNVDKCSSQLIQAEWVMFGEHPRTAFARLGTLCDSRLQRKITTTVSARIPPSPFLELL